MRILHVIYDDLRNPWVGGGGAVRTFEIYRRFAEWGHRVVVVCGSYPGAPRKERREGVIYRHVGRGPNHVTSRLTFVAGAARLIMAGGYDIVIEDVSPYSPVFSPLWSRRAPAVASVQNLSGSHAPLKHGLLGLIPKMMERPLLKSFRHFVAVSPGIEAQLRAMRPGADFRVVPNSAAPAFYSDAQAEDSLSNAKPYILFLGRADPYQKGLDRLVDAFERVADEHPQVRLLIVGSATVDGELDLEGIVGKARHRERIERLPQVPTERAARLMRNAVLLAMPSRYEAWPITAIEAGAAGVPVAGFDIVGVRDAAPAYPLGHGVLVPEGETEALAAEMLRLVEDEERRRKIGAQGRAWAASFTWDALAQSQLDFYKEIVEKRRSSRHVQRGEPSSASL
jgi:glycosyltransferase involved in cell wall biosynthesis